MTHLHMGHEGDLTFSLCTPRTPRLVDVGHDLLTMGECVCVRERERERKRERKREKERERKREREKEREKETERIRERETMREGDLTISLRTRMRHELCGM